MRASDKPKSQSTLEEDIPIHIFTVSSAMVGVCLTVIGIIRLLITLRKTDTIADDLLSADAALFLLATLFSYWLCAGAARDGGRFWNARPTVCFWRRCY